MVISSINLCDVHIYISIGLCPYKILQANTDGVRKKFLSAIVL